MILRAKIVVWLESYSLDVSIRQSPDASLAICLRHGNLGIEKIGLAVSFGGGQCQSVRHSLIGQRYKV
jgi:hypothetical protein